jgi:hypothetical protein
MAPREAWRRRPTVRAAVDLVIEARAVREEVEVVGGGGAPAPGQLGEANLGGDAHGLRREPRPDGVEGAQPREQVGILRGGTARVSDW